jgi:FemAB-related protein (PEP-CTERM system-associated)
MNIEKLDNTNIDRKIWDDYVYAHASADHYHLSGWGRVFATAYRHSPLYLTAWDGPKLRGIVSVVRMGGMGRRKSLVSLPFLDYGGICADDPIVVQGLYEAICAEAMGQGEVLIDLRQRWALPLPLQEYGDKVTMILELTSDTAEMWKRFGPKLRNQIRKAEKEKLWTQWCREEGLTDFYRVYAHNMRDLGSPPHSLRFFQAVLTTFPDARILHVRLANEVIGGALCLAFRDTMMVPWASSLRDYFRLCPNNLLYWEAIRTACEQGMQHFDFGRSSHASGTYKFKKQWGALEEPLHWVSNTPGGDTLSESDSDVFGLAVRVWQSLPVGVTRLIGPLIRRRISN